MPAMIRAKNADGDKLQPTVSVHGFAASAGRQNAAELTSTAPDLLAFFAARASVLILTIVLLDLHRAELVESAIEGVH